ncbi:hypothetical protein BC938DRAFT_481467 [Jimgerdemannia flammicorona]|uniref:Uncharacterized protein n=1 Tax=Jimgerdemannia flammicorona TaxID=994334 RepID=A0A433QG68_9FUNG|nr:hypothetical protein BC938DRAFT_481467 [Jimgerdemannia flammicorona]
MSIHPHSSIISVHQLYIHAVTVAGPFRRSGKVMDAEVIVRDSWKDGEEDHANAHKTKEKRKKGGQAGQIGTVGCTQPWPEGMYSCNPQRSLHLNRRVKDYEVPVINDL